MINFFRKIRKQLADDNKPMKYLRYAIGEILLVVVGILIALSINNWNEVKKDKDFETKMLVEIRNSLEQDLTFFTEHLVRRNQTLSNCISFFEQAIISDSISQDLVDRNFKCLNISFNIQYNRGPYDALKVTGIDKISNDSLRNKLVYVYDYIYPRYNSLIDNNSNISLRIMNSVRKDILEDFRLQIDNNNIKYIGGGLSDIDINNNSEFARFLKAAKDKSEYSKDRFSSIIKHISGLIEQIDKILK